MKRLIAMSLCAVAAFSATAATYYVSKDGKDSNDGKSWETALKTPQAGFSKVHNKDTANLELVIATGVYDLTDSCACSGGTAESRRVIIRGETGNPADVTLKGNNKFEIVRLSNEDLKGIKTFRNNAFFASEEEAKLTLELLEPLTEIISEQ